MSNNRNSEDGGGSWSTGLCIATGVGYVGYLVYDFVTSYYHQEEKHKRKERKKELKLMNTKINKIEELLEQRQTIYCSYFTPKSERKKLEEEILQKADTLVLKCNVKKDLEDIFLVDNYCASVVLNMVPGTKMRHGKYMWTKIGEWKSDLRKTIKDEGFENILQDL